MLFGKKMLKKAQSASEMVLFFSAVTVAILVMSVYVQRSKMGAMKRDTAMLGGDFSPTYSNFRQINVNEKARMKTSRKLVSKDIDGRTVNATMLSEHLDPQVNRVISGTVARSGDVTHASLPNQLASLNVKAKIDAQLSGLQANFNLTREKPLVYTTTLDRMVDDQIADFIE